MRDNIFIDSNIFLYAFSNLNEAKRVVSLKIISDGGVISTQVINEVSNNLIKKFLLSNEQISKFILSCYKRYVVLKISKETLLTACFVREKYRLSFYDSLIVSSAILSGCELLYTEDMQDGMLVEDRLLIVNPFVMRY